MGIPMPQLISLVSKLNLKDIITCTSDPATRTIMGRRTHSPKFMRSLCPRLRCTNINSKHHWITTNVSPTKSHITSGFSKSQITSLLCQNLDLTSSKITPDWRICTLLQTLKRTMGEMSLRQKSVKCPIRKMEATLSILTANLVQGTS